MGMGLAVNASFIPQRSTVLIRKQECLTEVSLVRKEHSMVDLSSNIETGRVADAIQDGAARRRPNVMMFKRILPALMFLLASCFMLLQTPCVGVSDILDFWRVMRPAGIEHVENPEYPGYYVQCTFKTGPADLVSLPSSSAVLAFVSRGFSFFDTETGFMDLRQIGLLYILLTTVVLAAAGLCGLPVFEVWLLSFIALDPSYLLFFNSFYADPSLFVALIGGYCWFRWNDRKLDGRRAQRSSVRPFACQAVAVSALVVLCVVGGASKMQYVTFPLAVLLSLIVLLVVRPSFRSRGAAFLSIATLAISVAVSWNFFFGPGPRFLKYNNYNAVFGGIAKAASNPDEALANLGISAEHRGLQRTDIWSAGMVNNHAVHDELSRLSRFRLALEYFSDPGAISSVYTRICTDLSKTAGHPRGNKIRPASDQGPTKRVFEYPLQHSKTMRRAYSWSIVSLSTLFVLAALVPFVTRFRFLSTSVFLFAWIGSQSVVAVLGEGFVNLHQHLIGARLGVDLLALQLIVVVVTAIAGHVRLNREKRQKRSEAGEIGGSTQKIRQMSRGQCSFR